MGGSLQLRELSGENCSTQCLAALKTALQEVLQLIVGDSAGCGTVLATDISFQAPSARRLSSSVELVVRYEVAACDTVAGGAISQRIAELTSGAQLAAQAVMLPALKAAGLKPGSVWQTGSAMFFSQMSAMRASNALSGSRCSTDLGLVALVVVLALVRSAFEV